MTSDGYPTDWKPAKLGELGKIDRGRSRHRPRYASHLYGGPYPFIQTGDIKASDGKITSYNQTYSEAGLAQSRLWPTGTLCITIAANIGETGILTFPACFPDSVVGFIADESKSNIYFVEYMFRYLRDRIQHEATGSVQDNINLATLERLEFPAPALSEQRAIAGILGALDDKIEVNRRMNATLESMARAVFLEMTKGRDGEEKTIGDVVTIVGGTTPSTKNPAFWDDGDIHWATPKDLAPLKSPFLLETNSWITELGLKEISSSLLPVGTVLLSSRAPIGYLAITQIPVAINQGFIAIKCTEEAPNYFMLNWVKENMEEIIGRANGTVFLEISKSNFRPMKIIIPTPDRMKAFVEQVEPLYQKIVANLKESRTLGSLRDSLLPKLMRGEVRVKDKETEVK